VENPEEKSLTGKIALDMIGAVLLAAALGIVTAFLLASVTLLFVSQAEAAEAPHQGTLLLRPRVSRGEPLSAPLLSTAVAFRVSGGLARARVVQTFRNPGSGWYDGIYVFLLPQDAALDHLRLRVGERTVKGEIAERPNIVAARVTRIGPHELIVVALEYEVRLRYRDGSAPRRMVWACASDQLKNRGGERADRS
jgi:Ca-activated chloride channel family protein